MAQAISDPQAGGSGNRGVGPGSEMPGLPIPPRVSRQPSPGQGGDRLIGLNAAVIFGETTR